jgi:hypothetical protein
MEPVKTGLAGTALTPRPWHHDPDHGEIAVHPTFATFVWEYRVGIRRTLDEQRV